VSRLPLSEDQVREFYHVTSKEAFWPILHAFKERYNYDPVDWENFRDVNRRFAEAAAEEAAPGALVWVHDYNLWLVPGYLRKMRPDVRIAFFHHTPFPSADMFNALPWRARSSKAFWPATMWAFISRAMRRTSCRWRAACSTSILVTRGRGPVFRRAKLGSDRTRGARNDHLWRPHNRGERHPVGVNTGYLDKVAHDPQTGGAWHRSARSWAVRSLSSRWGARTTPKAVSSSSKRSNACSRPIRTCAKRRLRLMHISVSANRNMTAYAEIQAEIEQVAGRINGRFGTFDWQPVTLISRALPLEELVAYYRAADVAWITPLADGMNLVCKEFIASRMTRMACWFCRNLRGLRSRRFWPMMSARGGRAVLR
jgi:trehalose-6-phosphate synthase